MTHSPSAFCRVLAASVVLLFSGLAPAQSPVRPLLAPARVSAGQQQNNPPSQRAACAVEMNSMAYVEIIVIPLLLFILMVGVVRKRDI